jgi:hypothetical protein
MAKFQSEVSEVKKFTKNEHLISDNVYSKRLLKFFIVYEFCLQCDVYARYLLRSRHVFGFKMLHRHCVWLCRNEHSQSNTQHIIFMNHGYMFRLPQRSPHQAVQKRKKEVLYLNVMCDIMYSICCRHNIVLISI